MNSPYAERVGRIRISLNRRGLDAFLVTCPENRFYLSGFSAEDGGLGESSGALLVLPREAVVLTDGRYETQARQETRGWHVAVYKKGLAGKVREIAGDCGLRRIAYEPAFLTCSVFDSLRTAVTDAEFIPLSGRIEAMRSIKTDRELAAIRKAVCAAETAFDTVWNEIKPGMTEKEVAWKIREGLRDASGAPSFRPIVASGPNAALPHAVPTDRCIEKGDPVIIDMGARLNGYCSDMTRTFFAGNPAPPFGEVYTAVRRAQKKAQELLRAGMTGRQVDAAARSIISEAGFGPQFVHGLGHGVGLAVHERPSLSPRCRRSLQTGMVVTVEPGVYITGAGGVRLENMVVVQPDGAVILNQDRWFYDF